MAELYIGLMSGTSADGIDAALVDFSDTTPRLIGTHYVPYPDTLREKIYGLCARGEDEIQRLGELDIILGREFARAANTLLTMQSLSPHDIRAIGSHGQTIRHHPHQPYSFTLQIGDPNTIAALSGITTIADFRRKDMAHGGHGAPLVPAFHQALFASDTVNRAVVNIGGIANITLLQPETQTIIGFDTGPGNVLLDTWVQEHQHTSHDQNGEWGKKGNCNQALLELFLGDAYFQCKPPKSTGREYFHSEWLQKYLEQMEKVVSPVDVQATLTELTARSIVEGVLQTISGGEFLVCGGGVQNSFLMSRLAACAEEKFTVCSTEKFGLDPNWVEAVAFAWLAKQTMEKRTGNLPSVTGAKKAAILGGVYYA